MSCKETFIPRTKLEERLAKEFGMNNKDRDTLLALSKSDEFKSWYKKREGKEFDENGDGRSIYPALRRYYNNKFFSVNANTTIRNDKGRFSSHNARQLAIDYIIGNFIDKYSKGSRYVDNDETIYDEEGNEIPNPNYGKLKLHRFKSKEDIAQAVVDSIYFIAKDAMDNIIESTLPESVREDFRNLLLLTDDMLEDSKEYKAIISKYAKDNNSKIVINDGYDLAAVLSNNDKIVKILRDRYLKKSVDSDYQFDYSEIMRNILTNNQLATVQQMNQYAMYDELSDGVESDFLQEVYDDNRMNIIVNFGENEEVEYDEENGNPDDAIRQELEGKENSEGDNTIAKANSHMGAFNDFMKHVDNPIKAYLGQLDQVDSIDDMTPDTNNELGLPVKMNVAEVCTVLYQYTNKTSPEAMRESIARIARDIPGMKGLMKIYNDTSSNSMEGLDLLFSLYTNFGKIPFGKSQVIYDGEESEVKVSNERGLRINALRLTLLNEFRGTGLTIDSRIAEDKVSEINNLINNYNGTEESRTNIIREINNYLNYLLPSLTNGTVSSYTLKDGADGFKNNAKALISQIRTVTGDIINLQISYESLREEQREIYKEINGINRALNKPFDLDYKKVRELQNKRNELRKKLGKLYAKDYTSKVQSSIFNLANTVIDNTLVRTDLNSPNIHGDMSSDIINNNMMTNLINTLQNSEALKNYGDEKFKSEQYRLSNILVEKVDDNGNIINFGLFRLSTIETVDEETGEIIEETKYVPTEYAKDLISFELFDGAINKYSGVAALYSEMTKSDYIATAFNEFFKEDTQNDGEIKTARYFTRIPSDAPKTFVMRAPKYDTLGLISNGVINRNHPVFKQMRNMFEQEVHDAVTALSKFFVIENGKIVIDYEQEIIDARGNKVKNPNYLKPKFKQGWSNETKDARKAFDIYHTKTDNKTGKTYFLESIDGSVKDVEFRLVGRVFSSDKFVISTNQKNYLQELIGEGRGNGVINFLYGREQDGNSLNIVENADGTVSFSFNDNQNKSIDEAIENFIKDYVKDCNERFEKSHVKLDANHNTEKDKIDFAINTFLMYNNFNDLLEGNTKFYKNSQDFLKRAKEMQASGIPYGIVSYDKRTTPDLSIINSRLSTANITIGGRKIELRNGFRGVTIKNTIRTSEEADRLFGTEKQGFKNSVLVQKGIIDIDGAKRLKKLYSNTKTNDAQSYITLDEWIRRVTAQGQFARYENLIRKLIDPNYKLTADEVDEFVQVQKNFYYDQHYNKELGVTAPRQIKNAEFVIIPKFVQGTDLEKVYNLMVEQDIDQLNTQETSKAGKANVLTLWNNDGALTDEAIADFRDALSSETSEAVELFSYNNLYKQQDVPQHMDTENKAGIQIMKKILDNIVEEYDESGKPTGLYAKKKELMAAYSENIKESFAKLMETLDIPLNENGYPELEYVENSEYEDLGHWKIKGLNYEKLFKLLKDEARRTGVNSNVSEFFELDKWGNPLMPPFMSNVSSKLESIIQSLFNNNITRQKLPGFHAAQVTGVGIANKWTIKSQEGYFEKKARQGIKTSNNLRYHPVVNGEIQAYAEVIIPKPDYLKNVDDDEALKFMQEHNSDIFIGYRIPTEGKQSVSVMKVVGFLDKSQGSTIIVPDDWVSQTGADFDVDSIYAITMTPDKEGVIRFGMDNRRHRNNLIVKNMIDILSDPASIEENLSCSNFKDIIDARDEILEGTPVAKQKSYRSPYNFFDQADYQEDAMSGARLKGMSVTRDTLCSVSNTVKPFIGRPITVIYSAEKVKYEDLVNAFGEENIQKSTDGKFYKVKHNTFGWSRNNRNVSGRLITAYSSQTTAHILDAIKEGNIPNVNELTFGIYKMFPDLGSDYRTAVSFMMTPGVSRVVSFYNANRSIYAEVNPNRKNDNRQFVMDAVRQIAVEQGIAGEFDKYSEILQKLEDAYGDVIKNTFGIADFSFIKNSNTDRNIPFNAQLQIDRIKERGVFKKTPVERLGDYKFTMTSGGAIGSDYYFGQIASKYNVVQRHFYHGQRSETNAPYGNEEISQSDYKEGSIKVAKAAARNFGYQYATMKDDRLVRNWAQVKYADAIFAVGEIANVGDKLFPNQKNDTRVAIAPSVKGGTGYAVGMAINENKPVFVFDQNKNKWFKYDYNTNNFVEISDVVLTPNFAGIGTREINENGKQAIEELFRNTFENHKNDEVEINNKNNSINAVYDLLTIFQYQYLAKTAQQVGDYARVLNPDKFGAKVTAHATRKTLNDIRRLIGNTNPILYVSEGFNTKSVIEAIYPGIKSSYSDVYDLYNETGEIDESVDQISVNNKWIADYVSSTGESLYPPLNYFLKYATVTSTLVEEQVFATESERFRLMISKLGTYLGRNLTEQETLEFKRYILNQIYRNTEFLQENGEYDSINNSDDVERITGINKPIKFNFTVEDINNPTEEEKEAFRQLTPAQKVLWIKQNARDAGIFAYLETNLHNASQSSVYANTQTITFNSNAIDEESALAGMRKAWKNKIWFVKETVRDLFKYSIVAENYTISKKGITRLIVNSILRDTEFAKNVVTTLNNFDASGNDYLNYIRGHADKLGIPTFDTRDEIITDAFRYDTVIFDLNNKKNLGYKYKIINKKDDSFPTFIKLVDNTSGNTILMEGNQIGDYVIYHPLNKLMPNENSDFSIKESNNLYPRVEFYYEYKAYVKKCINRAENETINFDKNVNDYKYKNANKVNLVDNVDLRELSKTNLGIKTLLGDIEKFSRDITKRGMFIRNGKLADLRPSVEEGDPNSYLTYTDSNNKQYIIKHIDTNEKRGDYSINDYLAMGKSIVMEAYDNGYTPNHEKIANEIINRFIVEKDSDIAEIVRSGIKGELAKVSDVFYVMPRTKVSMESNVGEVLHSGVIGMANRRAIGDEEAAHKLYEMDQSGINPENIDDIENNIAPTVDYIHDYVKMTANNLIDHVKNFYYDSNDVSHGIDDPDFVKYLTDNPKEFNRLLNLLGDIKGFINEMNFIAKNNLDINAQDVNIQTALNEINKIIGDLDRSELISKINNVILEYLKNQSDDPLIINELYDYTHGYHNIGKVEDLFTDAQEAPIPLMQIVLHLATKNVRADDMKHFKNARLFKQKVQGLIDSGHVDLNKIIDENGRIIQSYNNKLVEDYEKYKDELEAIVKNNPQGKNSEEYIKKLHEYKEWKLKNFHQEYVDEYYREILDAEKEIIDFNNGFLGAYRKYKELTNRRVDILSHNINGNLTQQQKDDLKQVQDEIDLLTSTTGKDHIYELIPFGLDRSSYTKDDWDAVNNSFEAAAALDTYIKKVAKIKDKYFNKSEKDGFRETLKNKLKIVFDYESAQIPDSILANSAEYQDAKRWVELNAKLTLDPAFNKILEEAYKELGVGHLGHSFSYFNLIKARGARDINGIVDGTKFTDKDIEDIKKEQQLDYQTGKLNGYDLGNLIQNGNESPFVWLTSFWKNMTVDGVSNSEYMRIVNDINKIIIKVYDSNTKQVNFSKTDSNGKPLLTQKDMIDLVKLYEELSNTQKHFDTTNGKSVYNFIEQNVDTSISPQQQQRFNEEKAAAEALYGADSTNYKLWEKINTETIDEDGKIKKVPNHFIYGSIKPKNAVGNVVRDADGKIISVTGNAEFMRWIDVKKTIANDTIKQFVYSVPTQYYLEEKRRIYTLQPREKEEDRQARIAEWEEKNHIFNPYTHAVEPVQCWTRRGYKGSNIDLAAATGSSAGIYSYEPRFAQIESEIKSGKNGEPDYRNHSYVEGNMFKNYKGNNSTYNNTVIRTLTDEEKQVKKEFEQILAAYAKSSSAKRYIEDGSMPMEKKNDETHNAKWHAKQALHSFGWYYMPHNPSRWQTDIDYEHDYNPVTPGLRQLVNDQTKEKLRLPKRSDFPNTHQGQLDYEAKKAQIESENKQIEKDNKEISNQLMDKNWVDIMERFIVQAGHFNSVQENKNLIYFGLDYLRTHNVYKHNLDSSNLNVDKHNSFGNNVNYEKEGYGESTLAVYEAFARRFIFNQFKKDQGKFTKVANILQQMSSAKYMMLNITGGISNVLLGESQIAMESFANEYFSAAEWSVGKQLWINSIGSFSSHLYDDEASDIGDGLCKLFQTLEFDSITELHEDNPNAAVKWQRTRNALYALQTIGEHFMQNGALLTMLSSHRLIQINDRLTGKQRYVAWSYDRYIRDLREQALKNVISNPQDFDDFVKSIKEDPNDVKDYAWRKKDLITQFVKTLSRSEQEKFIEEKKKLEKDAKEKFEQYPTLFDQFELKDGYAEFKLGDIKDGIILSNLNEDDAYRILGEIKNKVISVNKKIHGVYDKLGASRLEQEWYGGLVMQYHKHIWPGIMKRWRRQGYYNEDRQSTEKGAYWSIIDFLSIPYKNMKDMPDSSKSIMTGIQNYFKAAFEFLSTIKLNYQLLPNYEQANIRRVLIEICAYMSAVAASVALKLAADDDDEKDGIPYNMAIYLTDRFASETIMYTPTGAYGEAKTLWSSPIAAQTNVSDLLESINVLSHLIIEGDDFDPTYRSGIYAGQNKVKILWTRNIPIVRSGMQVWRLPKNNKYYKRQSNGVNGFSDVIVNLIQED